MIFTRGSEGFAFFGFIAPIITGLIGIGGAVIAANQQKKAAKAEQKAIKKAEQASQAAYRTQVRSGTAGRGSGDFSDRLGSSSGFSPQLKTLTGQ